MKIKGIITINQNYLDYLSSFDNRVLINHGAHKRPNIAVHVDEEGREWAIPLTHNYKAHRTRGVVNLIDSKDDNRFLGALLINNMIPLANDSYKNAINKENNSPEYNRLLNKQWNLCKNTFFSKIEREINLSINNSKKQHIEPENTFYQLFNDYELLKEKAKDWEKVMSVQKQLSSELTKKEPNYRKMILFFKSIKDPKFNKVFEYNKDLKKEYIFYNKYCNVNYERQKNKQKPISILQFKKQYYEAKNKSISNKNKNGTERE